MRTWLRGKRGGLIAFLLIALLVAGGLGWATAAALRLEQEQLETRAEAELQGKLRLALWRLDSFMIPELAREASRPFAHYSAIYAPFPTFSPAGKAWTAGACLELSPLLAADLPEWMLLHFSTAGDKDWWSPEVLSDKLRKRLKGVTSVPDANDPERERLLRELAQTLIREKLLAQVRQQEQSQNRTTALFDVQGLAQNSMIPWMDQKPTQQSVQEFQTRQNVSNLNYGTQGNQMNVAKVSPANPTNNKYVGTLTANEEGLLGPGSTRVAETVVPGPMTAFWIKTTPERERLIVARQVHVGNKQVCQGMVLNWDSLQAMLTPLVSELFPDGSLQAMRTATPEHPERTMTALPVELVPGPTTVSVLGWTPLRIGLALAWAAALVALLAVALGGWSLLNLSERRIRFVSTVTHELRTPLTTLRLYLDMLTGGLVKDEQQKEEYLHTLNAETDRLNRLVSNVLDFSRLENQKPRLTKSAVKIADLLEQLCATWSVRSKDAGKDMIFDNLVPANVELTTDVNMLQQVLGNLIDNACKYTRGALDPRLWVRAKLEGQRAIFEVEDRGPGVPAGERRSIFQAFRRGRHADVTAGGVGLGLALAQRWAGLLGGTLRVLPAADNVGACFRLELPGST